MPRGSHPRETLTAVLSEWTPERQGQLEALLDAGLPLQPLRQDGTPITEGDTDGGTAGV